MSLIAQKVPNFLERVPEKVLKALMEQIGLCRNEIDLKYLKEYITNRQKWKLPRVSLDTFLDDPKYLGIGRFVYPEVRRICRRVVEGNYSEAAIVAGIGSGKTSCAEILACYQTHVLLCLRDAHSNFNLAKDKPITLINMGTTATQALENCFAGIKTMMQRSPWFNSMNPRMLSNNIRFPLENILLVSGNSKSTTPLGFNVFYAVLDEASFYLDNENKQVAMEIYTALQRRIVSRFGKYGLIVMISSPMYEGDFIMQKLEEAKKFPESIFSIQLPTWKTKPVSKADVQNKFYFDNRLGKIEENLDLSNTKEIAKLTDKGFDYTKPVWEIPGEYRKSFAQDPDRAKRDFAAMPSLTIEAFMPQAEIIQEMFEDCLPSPVQPDGSYLFPEPPLRTNYYVHIDYALNKNGRGDHAGLAMGHFDGWEINPYTKEKQKRVVIDLAERIAAGPTGEIRFEDIRNKIYALQSLGYLIDCVSMDSYQSQDNAQILRSKGLKTEILSVDRTILPYNTLKELIYSKRIKCHLMPHLFDELRRLEVTKANKVDHPPSGSKDVADAICGVAYMVLEKGANELGMSVVSTNSQADNAPLSERAEYYKRLQEMSDAGLFL